MTGEVTHHLTATGRMADVNCILQFEMIGDGLEIVGVVIHIMAAVGLGRAAVSAPISRDDTETFAEEKKHLRVPIVRREWPAMTEHDGLSFAPVFVIDIDVLSVFFSCSYVWHDDFLSVEIARESAARGRCSPHQSSSLHVAFQCYVCATFQTWRCANQHSANS